MIEDKGGHARNFPSHTVHADLVIIGGGISGVCCAITAAREGVQVALVQDRPVLGGNASSEVRLWILGATSHMGNNNRWSREGGVMDELLVENIYRNPEGNPVIFDTVLLEKVMQEANIRLFLNTAVHEVIKGDSDTIQTVNAFCSQNQTLYTFTAPYFCDASGDGVVAFLAGAPFRMGAESKAEFGERFAPSQQYGELLGHSIYFYSKDTGKPVRFVPPSFAIADIASIPRYKMFNVKDQGCKLWWIEYGGRLDTVHETETIKWQLWQVVYGVWDYIKNSGNFPEAADYTLEWVGTIPGKRESRRFNGDYMLIQQDIVEQRMHTDAVSYGGWSIDLHPADGVFSELPGCNQWHSKGIYQIPYRSLYSNSISNLFLAGRIISASHVAFGSTRVMATSANSAQAVAMAAVLAVKYGISARQVNDHITELQQSLMKTGQFIPGVKARDEQDLVQLACITASSEYELKALSQSDQLHHLEIGMAQMIPAVAGLLPVMELAVVATASTSLVVQLAVSSRNGNFTPDIVLEEKTLAVAEGSSTLSLQFNTDPGSNGYIFLIFRKNPHIKIVLSDERLTGVLSLFQAENKAVSNSGVQTPPADIGMDSFEFWTPQRRPSGQNMAFAFAAPVYSFRAESIKNGYARPFIIPNAWVAKKEDAAPRITLQWEKTVTIRTILLSFDTDFDHPMESVLMQHPETVMPFCIRSYKILDGKSNLVQKVSGNYQTRNIIKLEAPLVTDRLVIEAAHPNEQVPAAIFEIRCY
ncbi:FAD-dependent oxidoreductase [Niabella drilacis]|uniref:FAD dependent oxidoreductase n=1 Tax=Niabella drilacis (strain DSM 25811 / CCM 8410 / CCUG 62505 / LMG 26954 / E90) TaxID=1285928 RepID=A0A1G6XIX1_NIADE|nr:FAD-dependent oxidoreductase [Niabella drilacis]SDD78148.1 FAD dependent oxidoreductase [Niabella drilacis]